LLFSIQFIEIVGCGADELLQKKLPKSALAQCLVDTSAQLGSHTCSGSVSSSNFLVGYFGHFVELMS